MIRSDKGIIELRGHRAMIMAEFGVIVHRLVEVLGEEDVRMAFEDAFKTEETIEEETMQLKNSLADAMVEALKAIAERSK